MGRHKFEESFVYALVCPLTEEPRYIGISCSDPWGRYQWHISEAKNSDIKSHKANWIRKIATYGLVPEFVIIDSGVWSWDELCDREIWWIAQYRQWGYSLTNVTAGGDGLRGYGAPRTQEWSQRLSISITLSQATMTEEAKKARSDKRLQTLVERYGTASVMQFVDQSKLGSAWRGKEIPQAVKSKMSEGQKKKWERIHNEGRYDEVRSNISRGTRIGMSKLEQFATEELA